MQENELQRIADQLTRSVEGNAWHGPALFEVLKDINAEQAAHKFLANAHSIWEIVNHITAWQNAGTRRINGDTAMLEGEDDWPPVKDISAEAWQNSKEELKASYRKLKYEILNFPLTDLYETVLQMDQTYYILFQGIVQHNLYHAGQIAIIKKSFS